VAIGKLRRRIQELEQLDVVTSVQRDTGAVTVCRSNIRDTIREIFGPNSLESKEYGHIDIWAGPIHMNMQRHDIVASTQRGRTKVVGILNGLIRRLEEKKMDLAAGTTLSPSVSFDRTNLHARIRDVSRDLFVDGHPWDAVFGLEGIGELRQGTFRPSRSRRSAIDEISIFSERSDLGI
jgi:hypothetical protein